MLKPTILKENNYNEEDLEQLKKSRKVWKIFDIYEQQLTELFEVTHPSHKLSNNFDKEKNNFLTAKTKGNSNIRGNWIYLPWNGNLIHAVNEDEYFALRTNRNQNIITASEQKKLYESCIGFLGLSIGSHMALSLTYTGIGRTLKLAEFDTLESSNLNRLAAGIQDVGKNKIDLTLQKIFEIDPYASPIAFNKGLSETSLNEFINSDPKPSVIFEAIDDFEMKIKVRIKAREIGIPVVMLTNLGDNLLVDIERYDLEKNLPLFNGRIGNTPEQILNTQIGEAEKIKFAIKIVGLEHLPTRVLSSMFEINKTLVGRPQIYSTVSIGGGFAGYITRKILLNELTESGRMYISFDKLMNAKGDSDIDRQNLQQKLETLL